MSTLTQSPSPRTASVLLVGNPNCGKSSLFNALSGSRQKVGNYPGITVEKRVGSYPFGGRRYQLIDLPGMYGMTAHSAEEQAAQREILSEGHGVAVVVADATQLVRGLRLWVQIAEHVPRVVLCLNMADEARAAGQLLDLEQLGSELGCPVVETVGHRSEGIEALQGAIAQVASSEAPTRGSMPRSGSPEETGLAAAQRQFAWADRVFRRVVHRRARPDARVGSDRVDRVLAHRVWGLPIFGLILYALFALTFGLGDPVAGWIRGALDRAGLAVSGLWPAGSEAPLKSLLVDGVLGGVGSVLAFLPNVAFLFFGLGLLEDTGYLARAAFLMDRAMHRFGLHGKSFVPLLTGVGCSVPAIMATRTLEHERDRLTTMLVLPLIPCSARFPIWMLIIPAFFPAAWRAPVLGMIYLTGIGLALGLALGLRKSLLRGEDTPFVLELPPYRWPGLRSMLAHTAERAWVYLSKAGTTIFAISVVMWAISSYPKVEHHAVDRELAAGRIVLVDANQAAPPVAARAAPPIERLSLGELERRRKTEDLGYSMAGRIGHAVEPWLAPLGFDWRLATAMLGAVVAKEAFVAQLGILYSLGQGEGSTADLSAALARDYSPSVALSAMLFLLIATPCMATVAVTRRESGRKRWAILQFGGLTAVAYLLSFAVYHLSRFCT